MRGLIFFLFLFFNFLNPISPVLTFIIDLMIVLAVVKGRIVGGRIISTIVFWGVIIWLWSIVAMAINNNFNTYVFVKYLRMPIMAFLISACISGMDFKGVTVIKSLYYLCLVNVAAIWIELYIPGTRDIIASVLNISRMDAASYFDSRVLGIAGSFEFCSIMCILLMIISYEKYIRKNTLFDLLIILIAFASMIYVSRTGMLIGAGVLIYMLFGLFKASKSYHKVIVGAFTFSIVFIAVAIMLPILINSSGLFEDAMETKYALEMGTGYGSGTAGELTKGGSHMNILNEPISEIFWGYGVNSEDFVEKNISTDIGYLEFICHIGILGLSLVVILHLIIMKHILNQNKKLVLRPETDEIVMINSINLMYLIVLFVFNYKLMLLYSRGTFELLLILLFASMKLHKINQKKCLNTLM